MSENHNVSTSEVPANKTPDSITPGPWRTGTWYQICRIPEHYGNHPGEPHCKYQWEFSEMHEDEWGVSFVGISSAEPGVSVVSTYYKELRIKPEDARLIAAAPELLQLLSEAETYIGAYSAAFEHEREGTEAHNFLLKIQTAIAKTEGR